MTNSERSNTNKLAGDSKTTFGYNSANIGHTKAGAEYQKIKFDNVFVRRDIDHHDHIELHEKAVIKKLHEYKSIMDDFAGYPPEVQLATVTAIISLDNSLGLEHIAETLDDAIQSTIFYHAKSFDLDDPIHLMNDVHVFQELAKQFRWMASHGCRRF